MKPSKSALTQQISVRLPGNTVTAIHQSGQSQSAWLRQAIAQRLEHERRTENAHAAADTPMNRLEQAVAQLHQELLKRQQSEAITQALLAELRTALRAIENHQTGLSQQLGELDRNFGNALNTLGSSLLVALSQPRPLMVKAPAEPPPKPRPPLPPRTRL